MKLWKKIFLLIGLIILLLFGLTARKFLIFTQLDNKNKVQQANTNVYAKVETQFYTVEMYRKGDCVKQVIYKTNQDVILTQLTRPDCRIFYTDDGKEKTRKIYQEQFLIENQNIIANYMNYFTLGEKIISSIGSQIRSEIADGKECYVISGYNTNFVYDANAKEYKLYIDKQTGLMVKLIEIIEEEGTLQEKINTYEYQFDCVTNEDVAELDSEEYTLVENE